MHIPTDAGGGLSEEQRIETAAHGLLRDLGRLNRALFRAGDYGLTRSEVSVLDALAAAPLRVTELAARTGMVQPRVTVILQKLQERELVTRRRCTTDRRAVETSLTPAGRQLLDQGRQRMAAALLSALNTTPVEDHERVVRAARQSVALLAHAMESASEAT
ncbi:MarR family winged helix-turn-helix transcriptional regulator [Streptomyces mexicanus]|jgi:DNA-binding MarR family transcriptional regulator|uniref:MarR family winged helix-turn-helix transcriptional regulator n=1 Tax=Streptomyces mexicanus TaxID=178566 RepID=UPI0031E7F65A